MKKQQLYNLIFFAIVVLDVVLFGSWLIRGGNLAVLNPQGIVARHEYRLIVVAISVMMVLAIPTYILLFTFAYKYRADNRRAAYKPNWDHNPKLVALIWGSIGAIILVLSVLNWKSTHMLDPYKPLDSNVKPITIQVVALQWKWLFIYPEENIATINYIQIPEDTPINFELTADAPMNSFWIPSLGGQMYAMAGMSTKLHLMADTVGEYAGSAAEINGKGFASMKFKVKSTTQSDFIKWVISVKHSSNVLTSAEYNNLAKPSENNPQAFYAWTQKDLYNNVIMKFMMPMGEMK